MLAVPSVQEFRILADNLEQLRKFNDDDIVFAPENRGMSKEYEARRDLSLLIENTRVAYRDSLQTPEDKIDEALRGRLDYIFHTHMSIKQKKEYEISEFRSGVRHLINALPIAKWLPRLEYFIPGYAQITRESPDARICFHGAFPYAADIRYQPSLKIDGETLNPEKSTIETLYFKVPFKLLNDRCNYVPAKLRVPFETGWFGRYSPNIETAIFNVWLAVFPLSPGKFTIHFTTGKDETEQKREFPMFWDSKQLIHLWSDEKVTKFTFEPFDEPQSVIAGRTIKHPYLEATYLLDNSCLIETPYWGLDGASLE